MVNNPFRGKPISKAEQNIEEWGKVKFKPTKFGSGGKNHFKDHLGGRRNNAYNTKFDNPKGKSNRNKDCYKFNQVAKDVKPENATPWSKYKDEIVFKQREEEQAALQTNMNSKEAKQALKQREINYRKLLMEQKKQEPTQWENFADEDVGALKKEKKCYTSLEETKDKKSKTNKYIKKMDTKSKIDSQKNSSSFQAKGEAKELISQELLNNFDATKLNYWQKDKMRKIITKTTALTYGSSLKFTINDMKRKQSKKVKKT